MHLTYTGPPDCNRLLEEPETTRNSPQDAGNSGRSIPHDRLPSVKTLQLTGSVGHSQCDLRQLLSQRDITRNF